MAHTEQQETETKSISVRGVDPEVWKNFKKLAVINDMSIQEYLEYVVKKELALVHISKEPK